MYSNKSTVKVFTLLMFVFLFTALANGQETLREKLTKIKSDVDKITITSSGEEVTFEGEEAQKLFDKMKANTKSINTFMIKEDGDSSGIKKIVIKSDGHTKTFEVKKGDDEHFVWLGDDKEISGIQKRVKVEIEDGQKKVTITTKENGEERTEVYEGTEAEEFLDKMKSEDELHETEFKSEDGKKVKKIIIEKEETKEKSEK